MEFIHSSRQIICLVSGMCNILYVKPWVTKNASYYGIFTAVYGRNVITWKWIMHACFDKIYRTRMFIMWQIRLFIQISWQSLKFNSWCDKPGMKAKRSFN